eukprot:1144303-Pelagomonas_calceolata.AAC.1
MEGRKGKPGKAVKVSDAMSEMPNVHSFEDKMDIQQRLCACRTMHQQDYTLQGDANLLEQAIVTDIIWGAQDVVQDVV